VVTFAVVGLVVVSPVVMVIALLEIRTLAT
jgi:hypothetical protein